MIIGSWGRMRSRIVGQIALRPRDELHRYGGGRSRFRDQAVHTVNAITAAAIAPSRRLIFRFIFLCSETMEHQAFFIRRSIRDFRYENPRFDGAVERPGRDDFGSSGRVRRNTI
jgi:hypothetical protein